MLDFDDDDDWQEMPTERSSDARGDTSALDEEDRRRYGYRAPLAPVHAPLASTSSGRPNVDAKGAAVELDYTRLELDDDPEEDAVHLRTAYLLDDDRGMTPLAQMQQTKTLLTEAQRIAYVALCRLVTREMVAALQVVDEREKIKAGAKRAPIKEFGAAAESMQNWATKVMGRLYHHMDVNVAEQRMIEQLVDHGITIADVTPSLIATHNVPNPEYDPHASIEDPPPYPDPQLQRPSEPADVALPASRPSSPTGETPGEGDLAANALPGVSTTLSTSDKEVTLDMRYTVICDLFLSLIADSVYDARSRVLLGRTAETLGLGWADLIRFERRLTEALELQEGVATRDDGGVIEDRRLRDRKRRYAMMGLAALGGGLVIGLSAGLLAPVIGAGLGAAFTTVGISGTGTFLAGTGGAALITTGGVITGANVGGKGMLRRTQSVSTFDLLPLHNNKRLSCLITVPGFMSGPTDDVRLPFSVLDPVVGDVMACLWEPDMLGQTGSALRILTSELITQVGQQVLQATVMTALMSALQWPLLLTKLGYLIDNPWSNALDRAWAAGQVLADILIKRNVGVRPVSLVGFSLGARVIFYALEALAKAKAYGIVQEVVLLGATVTASTKSWRSVRSVVSGRFVNGYSRSDWILGYLFRATTGGLSTVAGLRAVDQVPGIENIDLTEIVVGHMSYRTSMPLILQYLGYKVTADEFDEVEEESGPDREVITTEEEIRRHAEREKRRVFGLAAWRKGKARAQGQPDSVGHSAPASAPSTPPRPSAATIPPVNGHVEEDDDLPPREDHAVFDLAAIRAELQTTDGSETRASTDGLPPRTVGDVPPRPASAAPAPLSRSSEEDVDVPRIPSPPVAPPPPPESWPDEPYRPPGASTVSLSFANDDDEVEPEPVRTSLDAWSSTRLPAYPSSNAWDDHDDPKW